MRGKRWLIACVLLLIGANLLFVFFDRDGKIARKSYIKDWTSSVKQDMYEQLHTQGVIAFATENHIYFDEGIGGFGEFLVGEGSQVMVGDGLYTYQVQNYDAAFQHLQTEVENITDDIAAIEAAIASMESYRIIEPDPITFEYGEENQEIEIPQHVAEAELMKEQFLIEKEKELAQKTAQLHRVEAQLAELTASGDSITVASTYEGIVTAVSHTLEDPLITIQGMELHVEGELTESERRKVAREMTASILVDGITSPFKGLVVDVRDFPQVTELNQENIYPMQAAFAADAVLDDVLPGYHADVTITLQEALQATVLQKDVIFDGVVWKMTFPGKLVKQSIETGIQTANTVEIKNGVNPGEWIVSEKPSRYQAGTTFITPLKPGKIKWQAIKKGHWGRNFFIGLLSR